MTCFAGELMFFPLTSSSDEKASEVIEDYHSLKQVTALSLLTGILLTFKPNCTSIFLEVHTITGQYQVCPWSKRLCHRKFQSINETDLNSQHILRARSEWLSNALETLFIFWFSLCPVSPSRSYVCLNRSIQMVERHPQVSKSSEVFALPQEFMVAFIRLLHHLLLFRSRGCFSGYTTKDHTAKRVPL